MKTILALAAIATAAAALATAADASEKRKIYRTYTYVEVVEEPRDEPRYAARRDRETAEDVAANSRDPAGNYKDYPSWARAALSGGGRRH